MLQNIHPGSSWEPKRARISLARTEKNGSKKDLHIDKKKAKQTPNNSSRRFGNKIYDLLSVPIFSSSFHLGFNAHPKWVFGKISFTDKTWFIFPSVCLFSVFFSLISSPTFLRGHTITTAIKTFSPGRVFVFLRPMLGTLSRVPV